MHSALDFFGSHRVQLNKASHCLLLWQSDERQGCWQTRCLQYYTDSAMGCWAVIIPASQRAGEDGEGNVEDSALWKIWFVFIKTFSTFSINIAWSAFLAWCTQTHTQHELEQGWELQWGQPLLVLGLWIIPLCYSSPCHLWPNEWCLQLCQCLSS